MTFKGGEFWDNEYETSKKGVRLMTFSEDGTFTLFQKEKCDIYFNEWKLEGTWTLEDSKENSQSKAMIRISLTREIKTRFMYGTTETERTVTLYVPLPNRVGVIKVDDPVLGNADWTDGKKRASVELPAVFRNGDGNVSFKPDGTVVHIESQGGALGASSLTYEGTWEMEESINQIKVHFTKLTYTDTESPGYDVSDVDRVGHYSLPDKFNQITFMENQHLGPLLFSKKL
jgi:hypothetical protein